MSDHLESELAAVLKMSRTPVREAILTLEGQGLLELRPRKGVRILPLSPEDMAEIYDILTELESLAAARAAEAGHGPEGLKTLATSIDRMDVAIAAQDLDAWAAADDDFHAELVRLGGNRRITALVAMMADQVRRARAITLGLRPLPVKSNEDHRKVYTAIAAGDAALARDTHHAHRRAAKALIVGLLEKHRLRFV